MRNRKWKLMAAAVIGAAWLSGCGDDANDEEKALADFSASMSDFTEYIKEANDEINGLDVNKKESADELLEILDEMDAEFVKLADLDVPIQYQTVETLADEASANMSQAVAYYHSAYEAEEFDKNTADAAYEYYKHAMIRIEYIGYVLAGDEIPQNDNVTIDYEDSMDSHILNKWLSDDEAEENLTSEVDN